jgi:23S rRNA pseudouridine2605 synthase
MRDQFSQGGDSDRQSGRRERTSKPYQSKDRVSGNKERVYSSRFGSDKRNDDLGGNRERPERSERTERPERRSWNNESSYNREGYNPENRQGQRPYSQNQNRTSSYNRRDDDRPAPSRSYGDRDRDSRSSSYPRSSSSSPYSRAPRFERNVDGNRDTNSDRSSQRREGGYRSFNRDDNNNHRSGYNRDNRGNSSRPGGYNRDGGGYRNNNNRSNDRDNRGGYRGNNGGGFNRGGDNRRRSDENRNKPAFFPKPEYLEHWESSFKPDQLVRLNKYLANTGLCSRREADEFIQAGLVTVNGKVVDELGSKVLPSDEIRYNGELLKEERKVYILLNKPKDYVTTLDDPNARKTVVDLIKGACRERVYPVGRLDRQTTGVLLLTNDGEMTKQLTHPKFEKKKIYEVSLDRKISFDDMQKIAEGFELEDGFIKADSIDYAREDDNKIVGIEIHSGKNRIVRRIFENFGYKVTKLDRVYFAGLTKKGLQRGQWRFLTDKEVNMLKVGAFA